jgi:hypothetical protein
MKDILLKIVTYIAAGVLFLIALPFVLFYTLVKFMWIIFGSFLISFIILGFLGCTLEECMVYSGSLSFFVGIVLKFFEEKEKN